MYEHDINDTNRMEKIIVKSNITLSLLIMTFMNSIILFSDLTEYIQCQMLQRVLD